MTNPTPEKTLQELQKKPGMSPDPVGAGNADARKQELDQNAKTAYEQVPTQEELLKGDKKSTVKSIPAQPTKKASTDVDKLLDDAAQNSNIGGG